jgi:hypothetical protein
MRGKQRDGILCREMTGYVVRRAAMQWVAAMQRYGRLSIEMADYFCSGMRGYAVRLMACTEIVVQGNSSMAK